MSDKGDCRAAPATRGLLDTVKYTTLHQSLDKTPDPIIPDQAAIIPQSEKGNWDQFSALNCSMVQCSVMQYSAMQCNGCSEVHCKAVQCNAAQLYIAVQCSAMQVSAATEADCRRPAVSPAAADCGRYPFVWNLYRWPLLRWPLLRWPLKGGLY